VAVGSGPSAAGEATEEIQIWYRWSDFPDGSEDSFRYDDGEYDGSFPVSVVRQSPSRFRLAEPCCVTPFGFMGPTLDFGTVIEVEALDDGSFGYRGIVERPQVYGVVVGTFWSDFLQTAEGKGLLDELTATGVAWEGTAGNITIQVLSDGSDDGLPDCVQAIVDRLVDGGERRMKASGAEGGPPRVASMKPAQSAAIDPTVDVKPSRNQLVPPPNKSTPPGYIKGTNIPWAVVVIGLWLATMLAFALYELLGSP